MKDDSLQARQMEIPVFDEQGRPLTTGDAPSAPAAQNAFQGNLVSHVASLPPAWQDAFADSPVRAALEGLDAVLDKRLAQGVQIFPLRPLRALVETAPQDVQVVIIGQDPYHGPNQAQGLAFSVPDACRTPPSLRNMFSELAQEYPDEFQPQRNSLVRWARQGVLLLNTSLTVEAHQAGSHAKRGWETITDAILQHVLRQPRPKVLLLWGAHAQSKQALLDTRPPEGPVHVLCANHPSPLSATRPPRPFMGCGHFRAANAWLQSQGERGIDWLNNQAMTASST
nr:uracil-DNA glycosylase [Allopusillimonas ginsengisoli]